MAIDQSAVIGDLLVASSRLIRQSARATGSTVSSATWAALSVLQNEGPHRIGDLARAARITQPGMTKVVQNLVADEWVRRVADTDDSRAWLIVIADKGRAALADWHARLTEQMAGTFADLDESEWATLADAVRILASRSETTVTDGSQAVA
ncbi:MarR family winged helix-turn-helix transcriptional regulator [Galbitalea sp. SE-J8]|uniref:MarR family winged helix-turn-helix transcriptional regulator n=1 Tax=Galbitalea sp. SE-J8 TaxID=3054952 RepID=UPI00259C9722|nr:MarR family winged helix-turn-helix transcriptional regulator [Galbitalea sp. SE-J8]MDM4764360.1 MarR family winged helix-turn-helix transcriptional regulator [Galbitalea sp. SE-J8]